MQLAYAAFYVDLDAVFYCPGYFSLNQALHFNAFMTLYLRGDSR